MGFSLLSLPVPSQPRYFVIPRTMCGLNEARSVAAALRKAGKRKERKRMTDVADLVFSLSLSSQDRNCGIVHTLTYRSRRSVTRAWVRRRGGAMTREGRGKGKGEGVRGNSHSDISIREIAKKREGDESHTALAVQ